MARLAKPQLVTISTLLAVSAALYGCGGQDKGSDAPAKPAPRSSDIDGQMAAEYERLPSLVMIGVRLDGQGREIPASAEMRTPANAQAAIDSEDDAAVAYSQGARAKLVDGVDELD